MSYIENRLTPSATEVISIAAAEARRHSNFIASHHLLAGFLVVEDVPTARVFQRYLNIDEVRKVAPDREGQFNIFGGNDRVLDIWPHDLLVMKGVDEAFLGAETEALRRQEPAIGSVALGLGLVRTMLAPKHGIRFTSKLKEHIAAQFYEQLGIRADLQEVPEEPPGADYIVKLLGADPAIIEAELLRLD